MVYRRFPFPRRYARRAAGPAAGYGARRMVKTAIRAASNRTATATGPRSDSEPLTGQSDYKTDYRKRKLTPRRRRLVRKTVRWKRKVVRAVRDANTGSTHIVRRSLANLTSAGGLSNAIAYGVYGLNGTNNDDFNSTADIREILREINNTNALNANAASTVLASETDKVYCLHATLEMTLHNETATGAEALVEAYYIRGRRPTPPDFSPASIYSDGFIKSGLASAPNYPANTFDNRLAFSQIGVTPFQCPWFTQHFQIYKRQKFRIVPGQEINMVIQSGPATFRNNQVMQHSTDRRYHGILFQQQGSPSTVATPTPAIPSQITYMAVRRYRLKMMRDDNAKTAFDVSGS